MLNPVPAPTPAKPTKFMIGSAEVSVNENGMISLTDLWKAGGARLNQKPADWRRKEGSAFIDFVARKESMPGEHIFFVLMGRNGGTYAHWQIALAYAKYLSPVLHMQVNAIYARYKAGDATLAEEVIDRVENPDDLERIERRARAKSQYKRLSSVVFNNGGGQAGTQDPAISQEEVEASPTAATQGRRALLFLFLES